MRPTQTIASADQAPQRAVVLGGGLIGGHTALALAQAGTDVTVCSRSFSPWLKQEVRETPMTLIRGSIRERATLEAALKGAEVAYLFAGASTPALAAQDPAGSSSGWTGLAVAVLDALRASGVPRVVFASSGGTVYGRVMKVPTPESHPLAPISLHGATAASVESYLDLYRRSHGLETVVLRYSNVYGPGARVRGAQGVIAAWCDALATGEPIRLIGDGSAQRDFLYATDAARAALSAAHLPSGSVCNVGGDPIRLAALLEDLVSVSGIQPSIEHLPSREVDVAVTHLDCTRIHELSDWKPATSLRDGLRSTWNWRRGARRPGRAGVSLGPVAAASTRSGKPVPA